MKNILVYTAAFYSDPAATRYLDASCELLGIKLRKYGTDENFPGYVAAKIDKHIEFLQQHGSSYDHVLFCDAGDTFYARPLEDIWKAYQMFNAPLVISAEPKCFPFNEKLQSVYPPSPTRWRFINSGHYMGETAVLLQCLRYMQTLYKDKDLQDNDQLCWHAAFSKGLLRPALDYHCRLFQPMANSRGDVEQRDDGKVHNKLTGSYPCAIHFNGRTKGIGEWFEKWRAGR